MKYEQKMKIISENVDVIKSCLECVLDTYYNLLNPVLDTDNSLKEEVFKDQKAIDFAKSLKTDTDKFENVLSKIKTNDDLTLYDISVIGIAINFCEIRAEKQIEQISKAKLQLSNIKEDLQSIFDS